MKYQITRFKSLEAALKELEPFIRNGEHLETGKPFKRFGGLRSRELLANWLLCAVVNYDSRAADRLTFTSDPLGGDGIIYDSEKDASWPTEHVLVPAARTRAAVDVEAQILKAIEHKRKKGGAAYASGKTLVVFLNAGGGKWYPNRVARRLPNPLHFAVVWVVGLQHVEAGEYVYGVARLLHELVPKAARVAVLVNPANTTATESALRDLHDAAPIIGLQIQVLKATSIADIDAAFAMLARERPDALFVGPDGFFASRRVQFAILAARERIPAAYTQRGYVAAGGLMSYGSDQVEMIRQVGAYTGSILKGAKPADLPVLQSTKLEFVINIQTARALGIEVPPGVLALADEVIE